MKLNNVNFPEKRFDTCKETINKPKKLNRIKKIGKIETENNSISVNLFSSINENKTNIVVLYIQYCNVLQNINDSIKFHSIKVNLFKRIKF